MLHAYQNVVVNTVQYLKPNFLIGVVFKISSDRLPSSHLRMNVHAIFNLGGGFSNILKVNLRSCKLAPEPLLSPSFIHPPIVSPSLDMTLDTSQVEDGPDLILTTKNDKNLQEVEAELVETITEAPKNTSRSPNNRNDVNCLEGR